MRLKALLRHTAVLAAYAAMALYFCRPLAGSLLTRLLGPGGDASVTLWNIWYFRYSLATLHTNPFWTDMLYWPTGGNLLMHQYTLLCNVFAFPLVPLVGAIAAYNIHMLVSLVLTGYFLFLMLVDFGISAGSAFVAGAMLTFSPFIGLVIDSGDGVCYQILWPAVLFFWMFLRALRDRRLRDAAIAAVALSIEWAYSYYYFLYCVLAVPLVYLWRERPVSLAFARRAPLPRAPRAALDALCAAAAATAIYTALRGQTEFHGHGSFRQLAGYIVPYLSLWALLAARAATRWSVHFSWNGKAVRLESLSPYAATLGGWVLLNFPLIGAVVWGMATGDYGTTPASWRGGGNPTDPLELLLPGTAHPLWGGALLRLYTAIHLHPANTSWLGIVPLAAAAWLWTRRRERTDEWVSLWFAAFAFSFVFTLGPWLKVFGTHTYLPLPFYFAHLLPVFSNIQHGMRFIAFTSLFLALLFGAALDRMRQTLPPGRRTWVLPVALALLALEFAPPRRALTSFDVPPLVTRLGERPDGAMLTLPLGANFNGISGEGWRGRMLLDLALQSVHHKPLVGGYLGRVSQRAYRAFVGNPFLAGLLTAQDGGAVSAAVTDPRLAGRALSELHVRWVLIDRAQIPARLASAVDSWPLRRVDAESSLALYETTAP